MKKILAFSGSNHSKSINQQLVNFTASLMEGEEVNVIDIREWVIPIYSIDMDPDQTPLEIEQLIELIKNQDGFIISSPEHNGSTPAFFKNIIDWLSRRSKNVFEDKAVPLMSTSPGKRGGIKNRDHLEKILPYLGCNIVATFSLPSFNQNMQNGRVEGELLHELLVEVKKLKNAMQS